MTTIAAKALDSGEAENLERQFEVYDALYAWCRLEVAKGK